MADQITEVQRVKQATMNGYFYVLTAIDLFVLSFMCILTKLSESLNKKQKQGFFFAFALIAVISVLEVVTLAVDGTPAGYRWLNILSNYLGFGLSPGVCLCLVYVMDRKKRMNRWFRAAVCCEACYLLFLALSIPAGLVFSVSADNVYSRGQYFYIYIIMYFAAIVYLSVSTFVTAREFQNRSRALIYPLMIFLLIETIIQVTLPELHVTWLCVTLLSVLYFIYCSEMWNQLDALTGLLNQNSYLNRTAEMRRRGGVLVAFIVAALVRISVGSATVAMTMAAGIISAMPGLSALSPLYLACVTAAIAGGSTVCSHFNDSGFWLVKSLVGMDEKTTLKTWTIMETLVGGVGFLVALIISFFA